MMSNQIDSKNKSSFDLEHNPFEQSFASKDVSKQNSNNTTAQSSQSGTGTTPQVYTPGGRKLPPLVLSPNAPSTWSTSAFPRTGLTPNESSLRSGLTPGNDAASFAQGLSLKGLTPGGLGFTGFTPGLSSLLGTTPETNDSNENNDNNNEIIPPLVKQPSKRGRKKGSIVKKDDAKKRRKDTAKKENIIDESDLPEDERRKNFLERNRVAASKCRQRKKQQQQKMEQDLNFYLNEYNDLTSTIDQLKEQSNVLRALLIENKISNNNILNTVDNISSILDNTNYASRLRGDANSNTIIPTVQPINPVFVNQNRLQPQGLNPAVLPRSLQIPSVTIPKGF